MFLDVTKKCTFVTLCAENRAPYFHGCGYYQLGSTGKTEKIQAYKKMLAKNNETGEIIHGGDDVRSKLGFASGIIQLGKADIPSGWTIFCQSTSSNRQLYAGSVAAVASTTTQSTNRQNVGQMKEAGAGGRAMFSGCLMHDKIIQGWTSKAFEEDHASEYVGVGAYPKNINAFPKAIATTFDSIAIDAGTRVTIFEKPAFQGKVLYSRIGPAIVVNSKWGERAKQYIKCKWDEPLETIFPQHCREMSDTDMHKWNDGSVIISEGEALPQQLLDANRVEYNAIPQDDEDKED